MLSALQRLWSGACFVSILLSLVLSSSQAEVREVFLGAQNAAEQYIREGRESGAAEDQTGELDLPVTEPVAGETPAGLKNLDRVFLNAYETTKVWDAKSQRALLVASTNMVRWFDMGTLKLQVHIDSKFYHTAKVFMHTGLGLFGVCRNYARAPVCSGTECSDKGPHGDITPEKLRHSFKAARRALKRYSSGEGGSLSDVAAEEEERELSAEAAQLPSISLEPSIFNATHVELLSRLIDRYESGLAGFEEKGGEDFEPCGRSLKDTKEDILKLIEMTAAKQIEAQTDAIENQLLPALAAEGLSVQEDAVVVVPSIATTRTLNFEYAVWLKLMGEKAAGVRLFSSEGTASDEEAVMNMETRRIDSELGSAAFGDPWRMHYDLFGLQAERHVGHFFRGY